MSRAFLGRTVADDRYPEGLGVVLQGITFQLDNVTQNRRPQYRELFEIELLVSVRHFVGPLQRMVTPDSLNLDDNGCHVIVKVMMREVPHSVEQRIEDSSGHFLLVTAEDAKRAFPATKFAIG